MVCIQTYLETMDKMETQVVTDNQIMEIQDLVTNITQIQIKNLVRTILGKQYVHKIIIALDKRNMLTSI